MSLIDSRNGAGGREAQRAVGERSEAVAGRAEPAGVPDPELVERPRRRRFSAEYKLAIVREADTCGRPGEIGALPRREGLYSSLLTEWRRARDAGALEALERPRGRGGASRRIRWSRQRRAAPPRRARGGRAGQSQAGDRGAGKRLGALGRAARAQGRLHEHRAMIEQTVN